MVVQRQDCQGVDPRGWLRKSRTARRRRDRRIGPYAFNVCNKAISTLREGLYETWLLGAVPENFTQAVNSFVQTAIEVDEGIVAPQSPGEFFPRYNFAGTLQQQNEHLKRLLLQLE